MKIQKNLSDADMFRGSREEYSFETDVLEDGPRRKQAGKTAGPFSEMA